MNNQTGYQYQSLDTMMNVAMVGGMALVGLLTVVVSNVQSVVA